jgi:antitoxin MazE
LTWIQGGDHLDPLVSIWGNSLALRIPSAVARQLGLRDGDTVRAEFMVDGALVIRSAGWSRAAFAEIRVAAARAALLLPCAVARGGG